MELGKHPAFTYHSERALKSVISGLISFGVQIFDSCYKIKNIETLNEIVEGIMNQREIRDEVIMPFVQEHLMDNIRIITAFENISKSLLLNQRKVVHVIDGNIFPDLHKRQRKEPIPFHEYLTESNKVVENGIHTFKGLTTKTLTFSTMFNKEAYLDELKCPAPIVEILNGINMERNELHFTLSASIQFDKDLQELRELNKMIDVLKLDLKHNMPDSDSTLVLKRVPAF